MKKDMIFFSPDGNGLTSTSANHIANLAKEMVREVEASLAGLTLYSTSVELIGTNARNTLSQGTPLAELGAVPDRLHTIAKANSLIAWLREAIKAKERLLGEVEDMDMDEYMALKGIELPPVPAREHSLTEDEYYASLSVEERHRYYELEALASVLGKAVHPSGALADAREQLYQKIRTPRTVEGTGRDALIYYYCPTIEPGKVDDMYFRVQKQFRETQAQLNAIKFECQTAVKESEIAVQTKFNDEVSRYTAAREKIRGEMTAYIKERSREIGNFRIVIPGSLKEIYEVVTHLGKK